MSRFTYLFVAGAVLCFGCMPPQSSAPVTTSTPGNTSAPATGTPANSSASASSLVEARKGFVTKIVRKISEPTPVPDPPPGVFNKIQYDAAPGKLLAYVTPDPGDGVKRPAIVWITGGDCNSIGELWEEAPRSNDQTAAAFRKAGIVMMFPSLRGGNTNPGQTESFLGEVDDVIAAATYLAQQPHVDPNRIYLGGHSTGGTLVLLVSECTDRFRAVFSFGPVENVGGYGDQYVACELTNRELKVRSPMFWLAGVKSPTFVIEGAKQPGNLDSLVELKRVSKNPAIQFLPVNGGSHFSVLGPVNEVLAAKILSDSGSTCAINLTEQELAEAMRK